MAKDKFEELQKLQEAYDKAAETIGQEAFTEMMEKVFEACPKLWKIKWDQYAPHFNDGDACTFGVYGPEFFEEPTREDEDDDKWEDILADMESDGGNLYVSSDSKFEGAKALREFEKFLNSTLGEDLCARVFGEDASVRMVRGGKVEVGECNHD